MPAPIYILDEIDAALDLSHTQHIGTLFRTRFRGAQSIVVSLKEGLFMNANVLFRTLFRDGTGAILCIIMGSGTGRRARRMERSSLWVGLGGHDEVLHHETAPAVSAVLLLYVAVSLACTYRNTYLYSCNTSVVASKLPRYHLIAFNNWTTWISAQRSGNAKRVKNGFIMIHDSRSNAT
jgi:hypothetical protein